MDRAAAARAIEQFLRALGHEPRGELEQTPALVAAAWCDELLSGERLDAAAILRDGSLPSPPSSGAAELVALRGLDAATICPHHLLPSHGTADVIYAPGERVAGFGAIARALEALTRRLTLQETAGAAMAELLVSQLGARGASCRLRLAHTCLSLRGAKQPSALIETVAFAGSMAPGGADRDAAVMMLSRESR